MATEYPVRRPIRRAPTHPGKILKDEVLPALNLSVTKAAEHLRVSRQSLYKIVNCERSITPEMALRLGKFCGNGPDLWMEMQKRYDLWKAQSNLCNEIDTIPTFAIAE